MSVYKLILKSLWYFRRQHLAVLAGTMLSTAVLTGALIIGDSVKYSLRHLVDIRLGETRFALQTGDRFIRSELAGDIGSGLGVHTASLLMLNGIGINPENNTRINVVNILGIDSDFWKLSGSPTFEPGKDEAFISENTANKLGLNEGDEFLLRVENAQIIPINAPFTKESRPSVAMRLTVKAIIGNDNFGRFSLRNNQTEPYNLFISRSRLASKLGLEKKVNTILISQGKEKQIDENVLNQALTNIWKFADAGLEIRNLKERKEYELFSERVFIDLPVSKSVSDLDIPSEPVITYLVNSIQHKEKDTPYSFVTGAGQSLTGSEIKEDEIIINGWLAQDLNVSAGDTLSLGFFVIGPLRALEEKTKNFRVASVVSMEDSLWDKSLMPDFPGLADAGDCSDWNANIPIDLSRIRNKDEEYWDMYRGTPKAFISLPAAQAMWKNQFGETTSFRFDNNNLTTEELKSKILDNIDPRDLNFSFLPVYEQGLNAVTNSVDFGELFLSLSFFIIAAGILLTVLVYSLNTESRKQETGILAAFGFNRKMIRNIRMGESLLLIVIGGIAGAFLGIGYNFGIIAGLNSVWNDVVRTNLLEIHIRHETLLIGAVCGILVAIVSIYMVTRSKLKRTIVELIKETYAFSDTVMKGKKRLNDLIIAVAFGGVIFLLVFSYLATIQNTASLFLVAGGLCLVGCIALISKYMDRLKDSGNEIATHIGQIAIKNTGKNKVRSIFTISLLALGTFSIMITGANRKTFFEAEDYRQSGTGGFTYWIETSLPVAYDINSNSGQNKLGLEEEEILNGGNFFQLYRMERDDASCLNLNQVQQPHILGVNPDKFDSLNAFSFASLKKGVDANHVWKTLHNDYGDEIIPAIADQTVITWGLKKKIGDTLIYNDEHGRLVKLLLVGGLNNSIFQGHVLISEKNFHRHFPSVSGSKIMLIDAPDPDKKLPEFLQSRLQDYGISITRAKERLAEFNSVENTYLSVFMMLGGLGMLMGTIGLGIVITRNLIERKRELALYLAIGFRKAKVYKILVVENLFLLTCGMLSGLLASLIGILPSILSPSYIIPGNFVFLLILIIFINSLIWIWVPTRKALQKNLIVSLRNE